MAFVPSFDPKKNLFKVLVRLSYFNGFTKTASIEGGKKLYRTNGLMYLDGRRDGAKNIAVCEKAFAHTVQATWPGKDPKKFRGALDPKRKGFYVGNEYTDEDGDVREFYEDTMFLKLTNAKKIKYKNRRGEECEEEELEELFQSGHWAIIYGHFYAVKDKTKGGNGVFATVDAIQYFAKDEAFTGGGIDDDEIDDYGDEDDDDMDEAPKKKTKPSIDDDDDDI